MIMQLGFPLVVIKFFQWVFCLRKIQTLFAHSGNHTELNDKENPILNSVSRIHFEEFLSFFALRRLDKDFFNLLNGELLH